MQTTDNYRKHTATNPVQKFLIDNFYKVLIEEAKKLKAQIILDAGCGEGFTLTRLNENKIGKEFVGIDYSEAAVKIGKSIHPELKLRAGSIYKIPFKDNSFDLVICTEVLEHLEKPEKALAELERVTKSYCIISVPHEPWFIIANLLRGKNISRWGNDIEHVNHWSRDGIVKLMDKYFDVGVVRNPFPWTMLVVKKKR